MLGAAEAVLVLFLVVLVLFEVLVAFLAVLAVLAEGPAGEAALGAWAANVRGIVAKANAIVANSVFFIFFFSLRAHRPLTFPSCARPPLNSIAPAGYRRHRNRGYRG